MYESLLLKVLVAYKKRLSSTKEVLKEQFSKMFTKEMGWVYCRIREEAKARGSPVSQVKKVL